ncbi:Inner membrane ABC transporter permease protein YejB [BD1-7 clade bacterium]|uniref:Inner membrane ABC transporter permease protein YejB n=1 Tax=BD1-7 clade bacterium TaxID=2029982 RepID=A0A5S9QTX2_9GAMM|nr:Inner membrane ABC transporter permease protein YejB [BD1-7 clade bacterium]CAA0122503.1 Inner membrane ABC transporter permease protein YejB [BD1-7 clade bacterium]
MLIYILKRLALIVPTLFGILLVNFLIIQAAPGGPVDQMVAQLQGIEVNSTVSVSGSQSGENIQTKQNSGNRYGLREDIIKDIEKMYGFDKPPSERFWKMISDYLTFNFGESFYRSQTVIELLKERLPVSISLGLWSTLLIYCISIPLGIRKAVSHGSRFDIATSTIVTIAYAIPGFIFAIMLIVLFAGGSYWDVFPLRGLQSDNFDGMTWYDQIKDYLWHICLPVFSYSVSGFAQLTLLTKNSFLEEIHKQYATTAKAKGLTDKQVLYRHLFRNSMLIIIAGFPAAFASLFFTGSVLIEVIFSLEGIGLLGFESIIKRDYPVVFGTLFIFTLIGLVLKLISDLTYVLIDPRIDFDSQHKI